MVALLGACSAEADAPLEPSYARVTEAGVVDDLAVLSTTQTTALVGWTEVSNGAGAPAGYRVKYAVPPIKWSTAATACNVTGTRIGAPVTCSIAGLVAGTEYEFLLMSYRLNKNGTWAGAQYSNVATGWTEPALAGVVRDLAVEEVTDSSLTMRWTQVDDGTGNPASYSLKFAAPPINWGTGTVACGSRIVGTVIGAPMTCTIGGLAPETSYDVELMSGRVVNGSWQGAVYSNVANGTTEPAGGRGIWVDRAELMRLPTSGAAWDRVLADAARDPGIASIADQDSNHDVYTLAAALTCVRANQYCAKARKGVVDAIGTEAGARWLAAGRNLGAYVIAADLLDLRRDGNPTSEGTRVHNWIQGWLTKLLLNNNTSDLRPFGPFHASANAAAQEGFIYAAVGAYLNDRQVLDRAWNAFRTYACDPTAPDDEDIYMAPVVADGWAHDDAHPCGVNPLGTRKTVPIGLPGAGGTYRIDGALTGDMRRGGVYQWEPGYTDYPWVGLQGFIPAALILARAGYPAFEVADRAVLRTHDYLWQLRNASGDARWFDGMRGREIVHLVNSVYGTSFPVGDVVGAGRTVGYTGWTHP